VPAETSDIKRYVVVATYNERANLRDLVVAVLSAVPDAHLIIVDDNSPDVSPELLRELAEAEPRLVPIIRAKKDGYGGAMLAGFEKALALGAEQIATLDADFSHDPAVLPQMFAALDGAEVALGSRYAGGVRVLNWHPSRLLLSLFANRYVIAILGLPVADATSGYRAYRRSALQKVVDSGIRSVGYSFLVEVLFGLVRQGCSVVEVPIIYTERREGQSKMSKGVIFEAVFRPWIVRFRRR
jgi:dolichol-phosphate mannosyltransferase